MQLAALCSRPWKGAVLAHIPLVVPALTGSLPTRSSGSALPTMEKKPRDESPGGLSEW